MIWEEGFLPTYINELYNRYDCFDRFSLIVDLNAHVGKIGVELWKSLWDEVCIISSLSYYY